MPKWPTDDFDDEIDAHLALEADALADEGIDAERAALEARRAFGNRTRNRHLSLHLVPGLRGDPPRVLRGE